MAGILEMVKTIYRLKKDQKASTKDIIKISIAAIVASAILPTAVSNVSQVNTTGWNASAQALWPLVPIFLVLGVALVFIKIVLDKL